MKNLIRGFFLITTTAAMHAQNYEPVGEELWNGDGAFTINVKNLATRWQEGPINFHAVSVKGFKLRGSNLALPNLCPENQSSCDLFKDRLEEWVRGWRLVEYSLQYEGSLGSGRYLRPVVEPPQQQPLVCKLEKIGLTFDREKCVLVLSELLVSVQVPGMDKRLVVDVWKRLPSWASQLAFDDHTPQGEAIVCMNNKSDVLKAEGHRRSCKMPAVRGIDGFENAEKKTFAYYVPTPHSFKGAVFSALFPVNERRAKSKRVWTVEYGDDDFQDYSSEGSSFSSCNSVIVGESVNEEITAPYKFFELYGEPEAIPASKNPFVYFAPDGQSYFTQAYQVIAYPVVQGEIDKTSPYVLQYFIATNIACGTHSLRKAGFGLRWPILDVDGRRILPQACHSELLDKETMEMCLKTLVVEKDNNSPRAIYNFNSDQQESKKAADALSSVFVKNDACVSIIVNEANEYFALPAITKILSDVQVADLELSFPCLGNLPEFYEHFGTMHTLRRLKISTCNRFLYSCSNRSLPPNLVSLEIYETGPDASSSYADGIGCVMSMVQKTRLPYLKKLVFHTIGTKTIEDAFGKLGEIIKASPSLEELEINLPSFFDAYWANEAPGLKTCAGCPGAYLYEPWVVHAETDFEKLWSDVRDNFGNAIKKSKIKTLRVRLPATPPRGCDNVQQGSNTYRATPTPHHRQWRHLMRLLDELPRHEITVTRF